MPKPLARKRGMRARTEGRTVGWTGCKVHRFGRRAQVDTASQFAVHKEDEQRKRKRVRRTNANVSECLLRKQTRCWNLVF